jgi:hypothetical protein
MPIDKRARQEAKILTCIKGTVVWPWQYRGRWEAWRWSWSTRHLRLCAQYARERWKSAQANPIPPVTGWTSSLTGARSTGTSGRGWPTKVKMAGRHRRIARTGRTETGQGGLAPRVLRTCVSNTRTSWSRTVNGASCGTRASCWNGGFQMDKSFRCFRGAADDDFDDQCLRMVDTLRSSRTRSDAMTIRTAWHGGTAIITRGCRLERLFSFRPEFMVRPSCVEARSARPSNPRAFYGTSGRAASPRSTTDITSSGRRPSRPERRCSLHSGPPQRNLGFNRGAQPVAKRDGNSAKCSSEWQDLNLRPPRRERGALPDLEFPPSRVLRCNAGGLRAA